MTRKNRPLSPHLQIYRPQLTSLMSIAHRITGIFLAVGTLGIVYWLGAAAYGPDAYQRAHGVFASWIGTLGLFLWSVALFYHLSNGLRHLMWDLGHGFEREAVYKSGYAVLGATAVLTVLAWGIGCTI